MKSEKNKILVINTNGNADHCRIANEINENLSQSHNTVFSQRISIKDVFQNQKLLVPSPSPKNIIILFICFVLNKKIYVGIHDVVGHERKDKLKVFLYNWLITRMASGIVVFSRFSKQQLLANFKPRNKVLIYYFSAAKLTKIIHNRNHSFTADYLYFGRANKYSGRDNLETIVQSMPGRTFLLMGKGLPSHLGNYENVTLINRKFTDAELHEALDNCHTVIFPYNSATQSGGIPLAIAYDCNIVYFDVGGLRDQIGCYPARNVQKADFCQFKKELGACRNKLSEQYKRAWFDGINQNNKIMLNSL